LRSLHYAVVALGTPNVTFLVALDTGSDLFWVPCDCVKCAPLSDPTYGVCTIYSSSPSSSPCSIDLFSSACYDPRSIVLVLLHEIFLVIITGSRSD
jgi:hypothetical protein